ncbi:MAG: serine/threonine-protein kinase [Bryobacterales bacterium]|nr:serine/threonine-protein kinase [Bryobacterales bacterium]
MTRERWEQTQQLFAAALEQSTGERFAFLERECAGDLQLRREVESLLTARGKAGGFLDEPALPAAARGVALARRSMQCGDMVGPHRLIARLGSGGMGDVWRAHDTRLGRDVALKFCGGELNQRMVGEARAIAALNHPNVCQLYDVGPDYLVMELVEGEAPKGPLPVAAVLRYASQIADALEAAHEKGIVHRDLKPGNILIRLDGTVKVLDFGIAKWTQAEEGIRSNTASGTIVGTPAWMSPEQARGQCVDKRADIWAFGLLLYQLATGTNPFERATVPETQAAVLTAEPNCAALPVELRRLIRKCLEKDPKQRLRDIGDAWELLERPAESEPIQPGTTETRRRWLTAIIAVAIASLAGIALWRTMAPSGTTPKMMRLDLDLGADFQLDASGAADLILSPDGSSLSFVSGGRLYLRSLQDAAPKPIGSLSGVHTPFFSPDGRWIAFFAHGKLRKISITGENAADICPTSAYYAGGAWSVDGNIVASLAASGPLQVVPSSGGTPKPFTVLDQARGETTHRFPQFLPGGRAMLFTSHNAITGFDSADIDVMTLSDGRRKRLIHGGSFGRYVASGHLLYVTRGALYAVPFDVDRLELTGAPARVEGDIAYSLLGAAQFDAAATGTLVFRASGSGVARVTLDRLDNRVGPRSLWSKPGTYLNPRVSPDGQRILLASHNQADLTLSALDVRREMIQPMVQYESGRAPVNQPLAIWTPDNRFVVFRGDGGMYWVSAQHGGGTPQRLTTSPLSQAPSSFSPDGRTLAFYQGRGVVGASDVFTATIKNDGATLVANDPRPLVATSADESHPSFSRDGRWLAYSSAGPAGQEVYVKAWPDDGRSWQVSSGGGSQPRFSRSKDVLYFLDAGHRVMTVPYDVADRAFVAGRARRWSEQRVADLGPHFWSYDVWPDQDAVVVLTVPEGSQHRGSLVVVLNAFEYLRRLAPAK